MEKKLVAHLDNGGTGEPKFIVVPGEYGVSIGITARSLKEAATLLDEAEAAALEAQRIYEETPKPEETRERKIPLSELIEKRKEDLAEYEESEEGQRFLKLLEDAIDLACGKICEKSFTHTQLIYMAKKALSDDPYDMVFKAFCLGYYRGYNYRNRKAKKGGR